MKDLATDTLEVLDHLGWKEDRSVHIVGHSMGGMIAQELVRGHPFLIFMESTG